MKVLSFISEHWTGIALIITEVLAFIPGKYKGIAQSILRIGSALNEETNKTPTKTKKSGKTIPVTKITKINSN